MLCSSQMVERSKLSSRHFPISHGIAIQAKAFIVCFNSGFDLSRLALDWETAKNGGWSLILSQWRNPKTHEPQTNKFFPRVVIKALNSKTAIIHSTRPPRHEPKEERGRVKLWSNARFLDVRTLLWALRNKSYSLKAACKEFNIPAKLDHKPTGGVDLEEIEYCRQDVRATVGLLNAAKQEYDLHPLPLGPDRMFSPASVSADYPARSGLKTKLEAAGYSIAWAWDSKLPELELKGWEIVFHQRHLPKDAPLRALFLGQGPGDNGPQPTINMLVRHGVRSCLEYAKSGDVQKARQLSNRDLSPHLSFVDMGGHGYSVVHAAADRLETDFICLPRPIVRQDQPDGGPILYRVRHAAKLWRKHERPNLEQKVIEGNPAFSI